jgi:hypothetical protein
MSDEHDDDGLSELFGPPGKTGQQPQQPAPQQPAPEDPTPQQPAPQQPSGEPPTAAMPEQPATPSWELPTTAMPQQDAAPAASEPPAAEPAPSEAAPDPLAWLLAGQQAAPTPVAEPPAPTTAFTSATTPYGEQPPASSGPSSADPFGVASAAAGLGVGAAAEDLATRRFEPTPPIAGDGGGDGGNPDEPGGNRRILLVLAIIGGVLLIAIIALGIVLLTRSSDPTPVRTTSHSSSPSASETPSTSPTPSQTPSASPTPAPTPTPTPTHTVAPPAPTVSAKATSPDCSDPTKTDAPFQITYNSSNAAVVKLIKGGTLVAQEAPPAAFPGLQYDCTAAAPTYTVTATGPGGDSAPVAVPITPTTSK